VTKALSPYIITGSLKTSFIGQKVFYYHKLTSTMDKAREVARHGASEGTVIIAGEQTAGKGRLKRAWLSPPGNIALSIVLYPDITSLPHLIMIASLAVVKAVEEVAGVKTQIKWPNDILINGKKVGGILIENEVKGDKVVYSIIGIGININLEVDAYPEISATATSLKSKDKNFRINIIQTLLIEFERFYLKLPEGRPIYEAWSSRLVTLGKKVRATTGRKVIEGIAEAVDESGALFIRQSNGTLERVIAGDVTLREQ